MKSSVKLGLFALVIAVAAVFGATQFGGVAQAQIPAGTTKTCVAGTATATVAGTATCTITVPAGGNLPSGAVVTTTVGTFTNVTATGGTPAVTVGALTPAGAATSFTIFCGPPGTACAGPFTITETVTGVLIGDVVTQTIDGATIMATVTAAVTPTAVTTLTLAGCFDIVDEDDDITGFPPVGFLEVGPNETEVVACVIDVNDNSATPDLVSSGIVSVTVGTITSNGSPLSPEIAAVTIASAASNGVSGNVFGGTANVRCGAPNTVDTCDEVIVVIAVRGGPVASPETFTVQITANYVPDNPALNTPAALAARTAFTFRTVTVVTGFVQGDQFIIRCPTALNPGLGNAPVATPGQIGGQTIAAVGVLPAALICEALFVTTNAAGDIVPQTVAPGTIEVSSLNGTLIDLSGRLTTNLRIACGTAATVAENLGTINPNTCQGVRFGVLGAGVGFVELRARYEPSSAAAAAGVIERETAATVGFIAPVVTLNLLLSPNPVAVGQTGTATLRFNRTFFPLGTAGILPNVFVDPTTGLPIAINLGSPLNGTVNFSSSNPAIASFTGTGLVQATPGATATAAPTVTAGTGTLTAATATVRCGAVLRAGGPASATGLLADFFGGCLEVSVQYIGNVPGSTEITAVFTPDLAGAFGGPVLGGTGNVQALLGAFGTLAQNSVSRTLQVVGVGPATTQRLVPGCNNVVAPANETVQQVAARVDPATAVISIWKQIPGTTTFMGAAIGTNVPAGVSNLTSVNALDAIFICVNAAATYRLTG